MALPVPGTGEGFPSLPFHFRDERATHSGLAVAPESLSGEYTDGPVSYAAAMQTGKVAYAEQVARDEILLTFAQPMVVTSLLRTPSSYAVSVVTAGADPVLVKDVLVQDVAVVSRLWLVVTRPLEGAMYTVTAAELLMTGGGIALHPNHRAARFKSRVTKVDAYLARPILSKSPRSAVRNMYEAALRQCDIVGGSRDDREPPGDES